MTFEDLIEHQKTLGRYPSIVVFSGEKAGDIEIICDYRNQALPQMAPSIFTTIYSSLESRFNEEGQMIYEEWFKKCFDTLWAEKHELEYTKRILDKYE